MVSNRRLFLAVGCASLLIAAGCSDNPAAVRAEVEESLVAAVGKLGFRTDMIEDHGSFLLVEGDIYLPKSQLRDAQPEQRGPRYQYTTTNLVSSSKVYQIKVDLSGLSSQTAWQNAARDAISHWSGITDTHVEMTESSTSPDITVSTTCTSSSIAAYASFPSSGNPGATVYVNTCFGYSTTHAQKVHNMVHELGHTIGFRHSNYTQLGESAGTDGANHVYGTPTSGNATGSVMNGGTALNSWAGFATSDLTATRSRYPIPGPGGLSVTNSSGTPLISWNAVAGATSYKVSLISFNTQNGSYTNHWVSLIDTTTSTSYLDTGNVFTGVYECNWELGWDNQTYGVWYEYAVQAVFPHGTSNVLYSRHYAYIAQC